MYKGGIFMAKKRKNKKKKNTDGGMRFIIKKTAVAAAIGIAAFAALSLIAAFIFYKKDSSPESFPVVFLVISGISGIIFGIATVLPVKRNGLVLGMVSTLPAFFVIFAVITAINKTPVSSTGWISLGIMVFCGGIGGIIGNKK